MCCKPLAVILKILRGQERDIVDKDAKKMWHKAKLVGQIVAIVLAVLVCTICLMHFVFGFGIYLVRSGSMEPTINVGDMIITKPVNAASLNALQPGTIITFQQGSKLDSHRIVSISGSSVTTKGDANKRPDPQTVSLSQVKGIYLFRLPDVGYLTYFIHTKMGWFLMIILPAGILVGFIVKDIIKEALKPDIRTQKPSVNHTPT